MKTYDVYLHQVPEHIIVAANEVASYAKIQGWDKNWAFGPIMSRNNGLKFISTRQFHDMSYNFDEKAEEAAKKRGQVVVYPAPHEIQIDIDSEDQLDDVRERIERMIQMDVLPANRIVFTKSKTEGHYHLTFDVGQPIDEWKRIALQCVLGSDPTREFLNCMRMLAGATEKASRLFETPPQETKCPKCGSQEIDHNGPETLYACGSMDYDQRPGTFVQSDKCRTNVALSQVGDQCPKCGAVLAMNCSIEGCPNKEPL